VGHLRLRSARPCDLLGCGYAVAMPLSLSHLLAASQEPVRALPMPPVAYGALAFIGFLLLLGVLWSFRGTAAKLGGGTGHAHGHDTAASEARANDDHQGSHH
jgi:hypothetical protein